MHIPYTLPHRIHRLLTGIRPDILNQETANHEANLIPRMKTLINQIEAEAFDTETQQVKYSQLKHSEAYQDYRQLSFALQSFDLYSLKTRADKLAFWINLYNMLAIDAVIHYEVDATINEVKGVFYRAGYNVGGCFFGLHDIEQGILRANIGHPAVSGAQFADNDPRIKHIMQKLDPRTHFALVCAAESCPAINIYDADKIDSQLDAATRNFINSSDIKIDLDQKRANLNKIFQWYAPDFGASLSVTFGFGKSSPILSWIAPYRSNPDEQEALKNAADDFSIRFLNYDWSLNGAK